MENTDPLTVVGVLRDRAKADRAIDELKQAGFKDDQLSSTVYTLDQEPENTRIVVTVKADGKKEEDKAFAILFDNGANNADLPPGTILKQGAIVSAEQETTDLVPEPQLEASFSKDSFFAQEKKDDREEFGIMDSSNFPHG
jgi:hypothetical protein